MKKKILIALMVAAMASGCSDGGTAERVAAAQGYKNVHATGYRMFGCGKDDTYSTGFEATGPNGERVTGVVCSQAGLFGKTNTVRVD